MAQDVMCEVNSCLHWADNNKCSATSIYIISNSPDHTRKSEETDCKTFESKS
ncbi:DUF1540 domain-containing protein [Paenibacillus lentus]|uniref:DUF1540 domain-containing protein n=1 Tax=Paenibacillus lentus TaxID=1338368 RepID=UPI00365769D9